MREFFRKLCCCFRPQTCKKVESDGTGSFSQQHDSKRDRHVPPVQTTTPPSSIITQVTKETSGVNISARPNNLNYVQSVLKNTNLRSSLRGSNNPPGSNLNGTLIHSYNNGWLSNVDKKRLRIHQDANENSLLPPPHPIDRQKKCLIVDLDETLVHSSFKPVKNADFVIPVEFDNVVHQVHVLKRPYIDEFLQRCGELFECVLFTASLDMYADPVANLLDKKGIFRARLFREACVFHEGNYIKDLNRLGRDLDKIIIVDNSPISYAFHPENAIAVRTWLDDPNDSELLELIPLLEELAETDDIYHVLRKSYGNPLLSKELYG